MSETKQFEQLPPEEVRRLKDAPVVPETAEMAADRKKADSVEVDPRDPVSRAVAARRSRMRSGRG